MGVVGAADRMPSGADRARSPSGPATGSGDPRRRYAGTAGAQRASDLRRVERDRLGLAFEADAVALHERWVIAVGSQQFLRPLREQNRVAGVAGCRLDTSGDVHRIADDAELESAG